MGNVTFGIPQDLAIALKRSGNLTNFIETGTYKGGTALWASEHFETVSTIEFSQERYNKTLHNLKFNHPNITNIKQFQGNSKIVLPQILADTNQPTLFWLDAHGLGKLEEPSTYEDEIPILPELEAIKNWQAEKKQPCAILIDDARLFVNAPPTSKGYHPEFWPTATELIIELEFMGFKVVIAKDVIVAVNENLLEQVEYWANS